MPFLSNSKRSSVTLVIWFLLMSRVISLDDVPAYGKMEILLVCYTFRKEFSNLEATNLSLHTWIYHLLRNRYQGIHGSYCKLFLTSISESCLIDAQYQCSLFCSNSSRYAVKSFYGQMLLENCLVWFFGEIIFPKLLFAPRGFSRWKGVPKEVYGV